MTTVDQRAVERAVFQLLLAIGEDPARPGLIDTPARVARWWDEFLSDDQVRLDTMFDQDGITYDEMVVLRGVRFASLCEHHLLPFTGRATVGYIPNGGGIIGLSKLARIVRMHAGRLQVQERMTHDIADAVHVVTGAESVAVVLRGVHLCSTIRGVKAEGSEFLTSDLRGSFRTKPEARAEFLALERSDR